MNELSTQETIMIVLAMIMFVGFPLFFKFYTDKVSKESYKRELLKSQQLSQ